MTTFLRTVDAFLTDEAGRFLVSRAATEAFEVRIVDMFGLVLASATADEGDGDRRNKCSVLEVARVLNEPGMGRFTVPMFSAFAFECQRYREVQIWRNGKIIHWGILLQYTTSGGAITWSCPGVLWHLTRRHIGPISINLITNPNFTTGLEGWTAVECDADHSTAYPRILGPGSARLVGTYVDPEAPEEGDLNGRFLRQRVDVSTGILGLYVTFAAVARLDTTSAGLMASPAFRERGLYIKSQFGKDGPVEAVAPLTMNGRDDPNERRFEASIQLAENLPGNDEVELRLYVGNGAIRWGATSLTMQQSVSADPGGNDVAEMARRIVRNVQDDQGKSPLNIGTDTPNTGIVEFVAYQYFELPQAFKILKDYADRGDFDFGMVYSPTTRTFTTYGGGKGTHKPAAALTVPGESLLEAGLAGDGAQMATRTIRRAPGGEGSDREVGVAVSAGHLGGLILEDVSDAPPGVTIDQLQRYSEAELGRVLDFVKTPTLRAPGGYWDLVEEGDTIDLTVDLGAAQDVSVRRILAKTLDGPSDTCLITLGLAA